MRVIWITGLPGVGKSSVARELATRLRSDGEPCVLLDGDTLRDALAPLRTGYDEDTRRAFAHSYAHLAAIVASQHVTAVVATVSLFAEVHRANRARFARYLEVMLVCDDAERERRRPAATLEGPRHSIEIAPEFPNEAHLVLSGDEARPSELAARILERWRNIDG